MSKKVLVVDLDGTLFKINTFHYFIKYLIFKSIKRFKILFLIKLGFVIFLRLFFTHQKMKYYVLKLLKHRTDIDFNEFVNSISNEKRELKILKDSSFDIKILATAAPLCYASIIAKNNGFPICLATDFPDSNFNSSFENSKAAKKENVINYLASINVNHLDVFITDHLDDLPLMRVAKRNIIVNLNQGLVKQLKQNSISFEEYNKDFNFV